MKQATAHTKTITNINTMYTIKQNNKIKPLATITANIPTPRTPKTHRLTIAEMIQKRKRAERDARLVQLSK